MCSEHWNKDLVSNLNFPKQRHINKYLVIHLNFFPNTKSHMTSLSLSSLFVFYPVGFGKLLFNPPKEPFKRWFLNQYCKYTNVIFPRDFCLGCLLRGSYPTGFSPSFSHHFWPSKSPSMGCGDGNSLLTQSRRPWFHRNMWGCFGGWN